MYCIFAQTNNLFNLMKTTFSFDECSKIFAQVGKVETAADMRKWVNNYLRSCQIKSDNWKPSEEQMKALNDVANEGVLLDLFNELLKLF